jgi:hypothetical protein
MTSIKVQCDCGQRYAFDVEPIHGRMPYPVACPSCGTDGTFAANEIISQNLASTAAVPDEPAQATHTSERIAAPVVRMVGARPQAPTAVPARLEPGQVARPQAKLEARAKILWGDPEEDVVKFLMRQNISHENACEIVDELLDERAAAIRGNGLSKMITGGFMMCVPVVAWFSFMGIGFISFKIFGLTVAVGLWGVWRVLRGVMMFLSPRSEKGDVSDD